MQWRKQGDMNAGELRDTRKSKSLKLEALSPDK
jgi:hypothetical protein